MQHLYMNEFMCLHGACSIREQTQHRNCVWTNFHNVWYYAVSRVLYWCVFHAWKVGRMQTIWLWQMFIVHRECSIFVCFQAWTLRVMCIRWCVCWTLCILAIRCGYDESCGQCQAAWIDRNIMKNKRDFLYVPCAKCNRNIVFSVWLWPLLHCNIEWRCN